MTACWQQTLERMMPGAIDRHRFEVMVLGRALPYPRCVKFLIFVDGDADPSWILRCHRDQVVAVREAMVLTELRRQGCRLQPELVACDSCEDMHAQLLRFCPERHGTVDAWRRPEVIDALISMIAGLHRDLSVWAASRLDSRPLETSDLCAAIQRARGNARHEAALIRTLDHARDVLARAQASALPQHGDFCLGNLLLGSGGVRLLDWEHFGLSFEPFMDVWMFALSLCDESRDPDAASLFDSTANAAAAERAVCTYASIAGVTPATGRQAFPTALAGLIRLNEGLGRLDAARRLCRVLDRYLLDTPRFMQRLSEKR